MDSPEPTPAAPPKRKTRPHGKFKSSFQSNSEARPETPVREVSKPVVHPDLNEFDVKAHISVKLEDRHGTIFQNASDEVLGEILDPAHRGQLAKIIEVEFQKMSGVVVTTFGKLYEAREKKMAKTQKKEEAPNPDAEFRPTKPITTLEALKQQKLPAPQMPGGAPAPTPGPN